MSLSVDAMKDHAKILLDTGVFDNITFQFTGVDLCYLVTPSANLLPIRLTNFPLAAGKDLNAKIHDRVPLYHGKVPADSGLMEQVRAALEQILAQVLAAQGVTATVQAVATAGATPGAGTVDFSIASPPVVVGEIHPDSKSPALDPGADQILKNSPASPTILREPPARSPPTSATTITTRDILKPMPCPRPWLHMQPRT